jgi:hypothetical protein
MPSKKAKAKAKLKATPGKAAGYSKKSLAEKLGLKTDAQAAVIEAPDYYPDLVGTANFDTELDLDEYDFLHFFATSGLALRHIFPILSKRLRPDGMLWISWPKKAADVATDLTENVVREVGLANGLVDVKVAAINEVWSGLKFVYRLNDR